MKTNQKKMKLRIGARKTPSSQPRDAPYEKYFSKEYMSMRATAWRKIQLADYKGASDIYKKFLKKYPRHPIAQYRLLVAEGDLKSGVDPINHIKIKKRYAKKIKKFLDQKHLFPKDMHRHIENEYLWFSHEPLKQFRMGLREVKTNNEGYYSVGVGATQYANDLLLKGHFKQARQWAAKGAKAWATYLKPVKMRDYYNPYAWWAKCEAILGNEKKMEAYIKRGTKLCKKPRTYHEFQEAIDLLKFSRARQALT